MLEYVESIGRVAMPDFSDLTEFDVELTEQEKSDANGCLRFLEDAYTKFYSLIYEKSLNLIPNEFGHEIIGSKFISYYREKEFKQLDNELIRYCLKINYTPLFIQKSELEQMAKERNIII